MDRLTKDRLYYPLQKFLEDQTVKRVALTISQIESMTGKKLPNTAFDYPDTLWGNDENSKTHVWKPAWLTAGYIVSQKNLNPKDRTGVIIFTKS